MILPCLTLSNIRYISRVKPQKGVAPSPTSQCSSYWRGSFLVALDYCCQQHSLVLFDPLIGLYQVLLLWARVDLGAILMKGYSAFPKPPALLDLFCVISRTLNGGESYSSVENSGWRSRLFLFHITLKPFGKGVNPTILPLVRRKL